MAKKGVAFDRESAKRIADAVRKVEGTRPRPARRRRVITRGSGGVDIKRVILDSALPSGATTDASEYKWDTATSAWVDTTNTLTVREALGICSDIATGTVCWVADIPGAGWSVISAACMCNEIQRILITGSPTGGTYTLTFDGQTTAPLPFGSTTTQIRDALELLANITAGDVIVTGGPLPDTDVFVEFSGQYQSMDVSEMTSASSLTGGASPIVVITTTQGGG